MLARFGRDQTGHSRAPGQVMGQRTVRSILCLCLGQGGGVRKRALPSGKRVLADGAQRHIEVLAILNLRAREPSSARAQVVIRTGMGGAEALLALGTAKG